MIQPLPNGIVPYKPSVIHRWIPPTWGWFWRLKESLLGRTKVIALNTTIFDCQGLSNDVLSALSLPQPDFSDTNGLQVWVMHDSELGALRRRLEQTPGNLVLFSPRVITGDRVGTRLSATAAVFIDGAPRDVGLTTDFLPLIHREATDLSTMLAHTMAVTNYADASISVRTNFSVAARIQVPIGSGIFMFKAGHSDTNRNSIGIVISVNVPKARK
jgi:hypothetical protein